MKRIKQIIEAMAVLYGKPSDTIREAFASVISDAESQAENDYAISGAADLDIVRQFRDALVAIAEDMEKAAKDSEAKA